MAFIYIYIHTHVYDVLLFAHEQELECKSFPAPACSALSPWWLSKSRNLCLFYYQLKAARDKFSDPFIVSPFPLPN